MPLLSPQGKNDRLRYRSAEWTVILRGPRVNIIQGFEPTKIKLRREESTLSQVLAILNERQCREIKKPGIKPSFIQICRRHIIILGRLCANAFFRVTP